MKTYWSDRSRVELAQRCLRARWLAYHEGGVGRVTARKPLPLAVGGAVHAGLAELLRGGEIAALVGESREDHAVAVALMELEKYKPAGLEVDTGELEARAGVETLGDQLLATATEWGQPVAAEVIEALGPAAGAAEFDDWLWQEQSALVEGLVRSWARRRLPGLLERYEVLEVEREGRPWVLASGNDLRLEPPPAWELRFMSRPDALLRERQTGALWLQSFKTTAQWDVRKERDATRDMQGLSEAVAVERATGERVAGIRYEYLLKGQRREDKGLSARCGFSAWTQRSPLTQCYVATSVPQSKKGPPPFEHGDVCWSWDYVREDGSAGRLAWQNWTARATWEQGGVRRWIDLLDASAEQMSAEDPTVGLEPRSMGWKSEAQRLGLTEAHPLESLFPAVVEVYRQDDDARDWIEQLAASEARIYVGVQAVEQAADPAERRSLLNQHFPQSRHNCTYPTECPYANTATKPGPCFGPSDFSFEASERYAAREPHHEAEQLATLHRISTDK